MAVSRDMYHRSGLEFLDWSPTSLESCMPRLGIESPNYVVEKSRTEKCSNPILRRPLADAAARVALDTSRG